MGRALAGALLSAGNPTVVWNRTAGRAGDLITAGATETADAAEAVARARWVIISVIDYSAVAGILESVPDWNDRLLINLTSGTPAEARAFAARAAERNLHYLDGAVLSPTTSIGTDAGAVLFSGSRQIYESSAVVVRAFGAAGRYLGTDPGLANAYDIALLDLFAHCVYGMAHSFAMGSAEGIPPTALAAYASGIGTILPGPVTRTGEQLDHGEFPGDRSTIRSALATAEHLVTSSDRYGLAAPALVVLRTLLQQADAAGHGADGLGRLVAELAT